MGDRPNGRACTLAGLGRGRRGRVGQCTVRFCTIENSCYCLPLEFARSGPQFILFAALQVPSPPSSSPLEHVPTYCLTHSGGMTWPLVMV
jgi:hypothetical protein